MICNSSQAIQFSYIYIYTKDGYTIDLDDIPECSHMQRDLIETCLLNQIHNPINPHSQRLLVASKKPAEPLPKAPSKKPAPKPKTTKAKEKAKAKAKAAPKNEPSEYSKAKQKFLESPEKPQNIDWGVLLVVGNSYAAALFGLQFG